jgi:hypothetical protein
LIKAFIHEAKYFISAIKKLWIIIIVPIFLSVFLYAVTAFPVKNFWLAQTLLNIFLVLYDILEIILPIYWPILFIIFASYYIHRRAGKRFYKSSLLIISGVVFIILIVLSILAYINNWDRLEIIWLALGQLYFIFFIPFCIFKIKHIFPYLFLFIKKYIWLIMFMLLFDFAIYKLFNIIANLTFFEVWVKGYTFFDIINNLFMVIFPCTSIIVYKNRKKLRTKLMRIFCKKLNHE